MLFACVVLGMACSQPVVQMLGPQQRPRRPRLWRAEPMSLVQLFIQLDAAHDTVDELGKLGILQFRDVRVV